MLLSKMFRVAREGDTVDGRSITRDQIQQMANNYDRENTYGARIWPEHFRGLVPGSAFDALGDVMAVEARDEDGTLALYAQLAPTPQLVEMNQNRQKIYSSIEMASNFAGTGEAYLIGLAVTDSPAVLGTQPLAFSQFTSGAGDIVVGAEVEAALEFAEEQEGGTDNGGGEHYGDQGNGQEGPGVIQKLSQRVAQLLGRRRDEELAEVGRAIETMAEHVAGMDTEALRGDLNQLSSSHAETAQALTKLTERLDALEASLDETPANPEPPRAPATGGDGGLKTDC